MGVNINKIEFVGAGFSVWKQSFSMATSLGSRPELPTVVKIAISGYRKNQDFSDALIGQIAVSRGIRVYTFDKALQNDSCVCGIRLSNVTIQPFLSLITGKLNFAKVGLPT